MTEYIEITVLITREDYQFRLVTTEWTKGSYAPVKTSKYFKTLSVKGLSENNIEDRLNNLIELSIKKFQHNLIVCKYCKGKFPPEHTVLSDVCHSCAVKHLNVIF
ncbi:hypothetical protein KPL42_15985 [Clostridium gasigenes]|uniref:hypothetical protein n=1 Tax=Clostridium gasigenes TaxID=94869 RepID=UPI001C0AB424|nr:hypothetical protein [Clostridium gasigenes]MBU3089982.1 hypothetical protein [Clostridium gasigenes]